MKTYFEQGPIRPPSEAKSLLIRVTRNCPWNKCAFCYTYQGTKFSLRTVKEVKEDIRQIKDISDRIKEVSWKLGQAGSINDKVINHIFHENINFTDNERSVAAWLYFGGRSVFLQDANSIIVKTDDLVEILSFIKENFPEVDRITSYCRSQTARRKSLDELKQLREAGLSRIHIGMESGSDQVLKFIRKGVTAADHIEGGKKVVAAGISLSEYIMPGLGGGKMSQEHASETARVLSEINPDFIRIRTLQVRRGSALYTMMNEGVFEPMTDEDIVWEIRSFINALDGIQSTIVSDHILNLLEELEGTLPENKERLLSIIDSYFAMPEDDRLIFRLGRRKGIYRSLDDLRDTRVYNMLKEIVEQYKKDNISKLDKDLYRTMHHYI